MSRQGTALRFSSSEAKDFVRGTFDSEIIRAFKHEYYPDQQLAYLGLPGEDILDVLNWREYIGRWTGVQIADNPENAATYDRMIRNVLLSRLERAFQPMRADIDDLLTTTEGQQRLHWPYHIVNLDYTGGLVNASDRVGPEGRSRRLNAIRGLFGRQVGVAFVLFLTLNLRDRDKGELDKLVEDELEELLGLDLVGVEECFANHRDFGHAGKLKIYVPIFLGAMATRHTLAFNPPILYQGTKQMLHFAVRCVPYVESSAGRVFRTRDHLAFINMPLYLLHGSDDLRQVQLGRVEGRREIIGSKEQTALPSAPCSA